VLETHIRKKSYEILYEMQDTVSCPDVSVPSKLSMSES